MGLTFWFNILFFSLIFNLELLRRPIKEGDFFKETKYKTTKQLDLESNSELKITKSINCLIKNSVSF